MRKRIWCKKFRITWVISHMWNIEMNMPHRKMSWKVYCPHFTVSWIMDDPKRCHTSKLCPPMLLSDLNIHRKTNSKRIFIISDFNKSVMIWKFYLISLWKLLFYILTSVINILVIQKSNMVICWNEHSIIKFYTCFIFWS